MTLTTSVPTDIIKMPKYTIVWTATNHFETDVEADDPDAAYEVFMNECIGKIECDPVDTSMELEHILEIREEKEGDKIEEEN